MQLAARDVNSSQESEALVNDFDQVLAALELKCTEVQGGAAGLAAIAVNVVNRQDARALDHAPQGTSYA